MTLNLANASQECEATILWKQIPYSMYTLFFFFPCRVLFTLPSLFSPSLTGGCLWGLKSDLAHSRLCSILCGAWFIGAQQTLFSMKEGKTKLILAMYFQNLLYIWKGGSSTELKNLALNEVNLTCNGEWSLLMAVSWRAIWLPPILAW